MLTIVQRFTELKGWKFGRLDGNTNVAARQRLVDKFNSDTSYFGMLCTTRTGGVSCLFALVTAQFSSDINQSNYCESCPSRLGECIRVMKLCFIYSFDCVHNTYCIRLTMPAPLYMPLDKSQPEFDRCK